MDLERHGTWRVVLTYGLWLISAAIAVGIILVMRLFLLVDLPMTLPVNPWSLSAIDKFGTVILGALWVIFLVLTEFYFRKLLKKGLPSSPILKLFAVEVLVLAVLYLGHRLI
jgi:hypothetical protein